MLISWVLVLNIFNDETINIQVGYLPVQEYQVVFISKMLGIPQVGYLDRAIII